METREKIKQLYWRAGFGMSLQEWKAAETLRLDQAIKQLFEEAKQRKELKTEFTNLDDGI